MPSLPTARPSAILSSMQVTLYIPDTLAAQLTATGKDTARAALEALAWRATAPAN